MRDDLANIADHEAAIVAKAELPLVRHEKQERRRVRKQQQSIGKASYKHPSKLQIVDPDHPFIRFVSEDEDDASDDR